MTPGETSQPGCCAWSWSRWFVPGLVGVLALDQLSKWLVFGLPANAQLPSIISRAENTGVAWSIGHGSPLRVAALTAVLIPVLSVMWWRWFRRLGPGENLAFGLILGGALGNAFDRACSQLGLLGLVGVRDFINIDLGFWPFHPFATFNVADAGITIGFLILVGLSLFKSPVPAAASAPAVSDR